MRCAFTYDEAERHTTPVVAACYNTLQPMVALAVMTALGEGPPGARNLFGSGLIVLGGLAAVALSTNDRRRWKAVVAAEVAATTGGVGPDSEGVAGTGAATGAGMGTGTGTLEEKDEDEGGGTVRRRREVGDREQVVGPETATAAAATSTPSDGAGAGGTVRMIKLPGSILGASSSGGGSSRPRRRRPKLGTMVWTVVWALVMSLCALAGGGFLTWSLVYLYWKYLC